MRSPVHDEVKNVGNEIAERLHEIALLFKEDWGMKFSLLARHPTNPKISMLVTQEESHSKIIEAVRWLEQNGNESKLDGGE